MTITDRHIRLYAHTYEQMDRTQDQGEDQQFHRVIHRIEPQRIDADFFVEQCSCRYGEEITEPAAEQCTPDKGGDTAVEEHLEHTIYHAFGFVFLQYEEAQRRQDDTIGCVRQHHTKEDKVERRQDRCGVDIASGRQAVHIGNCLEGSYYAAVMQQYRHFLIFIGNLNIIIEFIFLQECFDLWLRLSRHPAVKIEYRIGTQHIPYDSCPVSLGYQQVVKEFNIFACRGKIRQHFFIFCDRFFDFFDLFLITMDRFCGSALLICHGDRGEVEGTQRFIKCIFFFL